LFSDPRVGAGELATWGGLCLAPPAASVDGARLTLSLVQRRGIRSLRSSQTVQVPLRRPESPATLTLPVRGTWRVTQGHTCDSQHRRGRLGGEYAWDLVAINENGRSGNPAYESSHRIADSETYGKDVLSPVDGTVIQSSDGVEDNDLMTAYPRRSLVESVRNPKWIFGNYVVIREGDVFVLLGHLEQGSVAVQAGDPVRVGTPVGKAGNSGNTILPHVHVQVMDRPDAADPKVSGVPAVFKDFFEITARGNGQDGEAVVRRVAEGDPPLGAVLITPRTEPPAR
jgi:murein DD-endopeptidase MepM/ murein hydrolase activator NlpD